MNNIKLVFLFLFILLSINLVLAGKVHDLDFSKGNIITITINERDVARFIIPYREYDLEKYNEGVIDYHLVDKEHKVMIREVENDRNFIRLTIFIQDAEVPQYLNLGINNLIKLDFDRDSLYDIIIKLNKIKDKEVTLTFEKISEEKKTGKVVLFGKTKRETKEEKENFITRLLTWLFKGKLKEKVVAEGEGVEKEAPKLERPKIVDILANNWILTLIGFIVLLLLIWNRRFIRRRLRRLF